MAKSKKELLANRQKIGRPSLRRQVITDDAQEAAVVQKVADNPPPAPPAPPTSPAPAAAAKKTTPKPKARKQAAPKTPPAPEPPAEREPHMRMTFDVPKSLHLELKMYALKNGVTIKAHMLRIIRESIGK